MLKLKRYPQPRYGMTLVEILVVIGIVGVLISLTIPAVLVARESARKIACSNQLRQLAIGILAHEEVQGHFPTGGWDWSWSGDADRGFGSGQPGGWYYNVLPFVEHQELHDLGRGLGRDAKLLKHAERIESLAQGTVCPSRRANRRIPALGPPHNGHIVNAGKFKYTTKIDYAINAGSIENLECGQGGGPGKGCRGLRFDGISFYRSMVRMTQVLDGAEHTYLVGEKYLDAAEYRSGTDPGDNESPYTGVNADHYRSTHRAFPPSRDQSTVQQKFAFGAAHNSGFHMAFCDGRVEHLRFDLDETIHESLGSRMDGQIFNLP